MKKTLVAGLACLLLGACAGPKIVSNAQDAKYTYKDNFLGFKVSAKTKDKIPMMRYKGSHNCALYLNDWVIVDAECDKKIEYVCQKDEFYYFVFGERGVALTNCKRQEGLEKLKNSMTYQKYWDSMDMGYLIKHWKEEHGR
ncbi:MAG: hypothetical protein ABIB71_03025 [Candidatus Woesearchaeota archaeon]